MAPATGANENETFLVTCITNVKDGSGMIKPDWDKIGALLSMKPHTAYCRWNKIMKTVNVSKGGPASGSVDAINATFGGRGGGTTKGKGALKDTPKKTPRKLKQMAEVENDDEESATPKAKKMKGGKDEGIKVEEYVIVKSGGRDDEAYMGV